MPEWRKVDTHLIADTLTETHDEKGVQIRLALSPYDVPEAFRGFYDHDRNRFVIEFKYIQEEPFTVEHADNHLGMRIGKNSKRLYGFEIDVDGLRATKVGIQVTPAESVEKALGELTDHAPPLAKIGNYVVLKSLVEGPAKQMLEAIA